MTKEEMIQDLPALAKKCKNYGIFLQSLRCQDCITEAATLVKEWKYSGLRTFYKAAR